MVFNTPTCTYLDLGFDGLNSLRLSYFPKFPNGLFCRLNLRAFWAPQQLLSSTDFQYNYPRNL